MRDTVYLFVFDNYADWEPAYALVGLTKFSPYQVKTFALDKKPVCSMGGLSLQPDLTIGEVDPARAALLILTGGYNVWEQGGNPEIVPLVAQFIQQQTPVAAICAATTLLARHGFLKGIRHTSNAKEYLNGVVPNYAGADLYQNVLSVADQHIITANGTAAPEFADAIFAELNLTGDPKLEEWFQYFRLRLNHSFSAPQTE
ncbi:type 1 glutamine amidotransferase family protein [Larkinella ripae]